MTLEDCVTKVGIWYFEDGAESVGSVVCLKLFYCRRVVSSFEAIGCRTGSSSSIGWPAGESSPIVLPVGKQVLLGKLSGGDERLRFSSAPEAFR